MSELGDYGDFYWCAKVVKDICPAGEIYVYADRAEVVGGNLFFVSNGRHRHNLVIAAGGWKAFFVASVLDGHAVAVMHWEGEVQR